MGETSHSESQAVAALPVVEGRAKLGRLKVFLGIGPGVGKTAAMLQAATAQQAAGHRVLIAFALAPEAPIAGALPRINPPNGQRTADVDSIIKRHPDIAILDHLAGVNSSSAERSRRYNDALALLEVGIDVYCTLNIYEIASQAEILWSVTGLSSRDAVPDGILDNAEIVLVDLSPAEILLRLEKGKIRPPQALKKSGFFDETRLCEFREMAARLFAEHAARDSQQSRQARGFRGPAKSGNRLLAAIEFGWEAEELILLTRRLAGAMNAPWIVLCVETTRGSGVQGGRSARTLELARELGAEIIKTADNDFVEAVLRVAHSRNITQIVTGKPKPVSWRRPFAPEPAFARLARQSEGIVVHIVPLFKEDRPPSKTRSALADTGRWQWLAAVGAMGVVIAGGFLLIPLLGSESSSLVSLLAILGVSVFLDRGPALLATALIALAWDYFFLPPYFNFAVARPQDVILLMLYFAVALILGQFTTRIRAEEAAERWREARATALYLLTRELAEETTAAGIVRKLVEEIQGCFNATVAVLLPDTANRLELHPASTLKPGEKELAVATWALEHRRAAGKFTGNLPMADTMFLPLESSRRIMGIVGARLNRAAPLTVHEENLLEALARQAALALDRQQLSEISEKSKFLAESERLGKTLLDSMSHEIRTPLSAIQAAVGNLEEAGQVSPAGRAALTEIHEGADRLNRLVGKVLDITRLESGHVKPLINECEVADIVNVAVTETEKQMSKHPLKAQVAPGLPIIRTDFVFLQQALMNLLVNAAIHTPPGTPVELSVWREGSSLCLAVADQGPGIEPQRLARVFDKFYRGPGAPSGGIGLGLSLVKGFVKALGGNVTAANRPEGGAKFEIIIPLNYPSR